MSARGANLGGASAGSADGQGDSPLAALSGIAERVRSTVDERVRAVAGERFGADAGGRLRAVATERLGPDAAERLRTVAGEKLKAVGGDRLPTPLRGAGGPAGGAGGAPAFEERPEIYVGAAFAGGIVLAGVIRLLGR